MSAVDNYARLLAILGIGAIGGSGGAQKVGLLARNSSLLLLQDYKNSKIVNVVDDFKATGNGVTNDTAAVIAAMAYCITNKMALYFPRGIYRVNQAIVATLPAFDPILGRGFCIFGDGPNQSVIYYFGSVADDVFSITGSSSGGDNFIFYGLSVARALAAGDSGATGAAIKLTGVSQGRIESMYSTGNGKAVHLVSSVHIDLNSVWSRSDNYGYYLQTSSNMVTLNSCEAIAPYTSGLYAEGCTNIIMLGGGVEGCGIARASGIFSAVDIFQPGVDGGLAFRALGCYFENNRGYGCKITPTVYSCSYKIEATFNRSSTNNLHEIYVDLAFAGGKQIIDIQGSNFHSNVAASAARRFVDFTNVGSFTELTFKHDIGSYPNATEVPDVPAAFSCVDNESAGTFRAFISAAGAIVGNSSGIVSVNRTGLGTYVITMGKPVNDGGGLPQIFPNVTLQTDWGSGNLTNFTGNTFTVNIKQGASATDMAFFLTGTYCTI